MYYAREASQADGLDGLGKKAKAKKPAAAAPLMMSAPPAAIPRQFVVAGAVLGVVMVGFLVYRFVKK